MTNMTPDPHQPPFIPAPQYQIPPNQPYPGPAPVYAPILPPKKHTVRNVLLIVTVGLVALCGVGTIVAAASSGDKPATHAAAVLPSSTAQHIQPGQQDPGIAPAASGNVITVPVSPAAKPTTQAPKSKVTTPPPPPAAPQLTTGQQQALGDARDYLNVSHFSRKGLIDQLKFDGFSDADATYAADHVGADWMAQAAGAAADYLRVSHFSHSGMVDQLEFDGFSQAEAEHGASAVGL